MMIIKISLVVCLAAITISASSGGLLNARQAFNEYAGSDDCMNFDEFAEFAVNDMKLLQQFAAFDVDKDGALSYAELVFVLTELESFPAAHSDEATSALQMAFGEDYSESAAPELVAQLFFQAMDTEHEDVITESNYVAVMVDDLWSEFNADSEACIAFAQFNRGCKENAMERAREVAAEEVENGECDLDEISNNIRNANPQQVAAMHLRFQPHQFDASDRRRMLIWLLAIAMWGGLLATLFYADSKSALSVNPVIDSFNPWSAAPHHQFDWTHILMMAAALLLVLNVVCIVYYLKRPTKRAPKRHAFQAVNAQDSESEMEKNDLL